ncbi:uncharacterized protein METZ01_LOCUS117876, partial [marine metagenome]
VVTPNLVVSFSFFPNLKIKVPLISLNVLGMYTELLACNFEMPTMLNLPDPPSPTALQDFSA